jgi:GTP-binding protein EngB required for normal cell division
MPTYNISLLGTEGTGKSCFLAGLNYIGSNPLNDSLTVFPKMNDPVAKQYLENAADEFRCGKFPKGTQETTFLEFDVQPKNSRNVMTIRTVDYPGEDFRDGITKGTPQEKIKEFAEHLLKSDIIILLIDPKDIPDSENNKQSAKRNKILNSINANLQAARHKLVQTTEKDKTLKADVCIAVTKFDRLPEFEKAKNARDGGQQVAKDFVLEHWKNFEKNLAGATDISLKKKEYFPISAVGNTLQTDNTDAYRDEDNPVVPDKDNLAPFGYDVLFHWIEDRKNKIRFRKTMFRLFCAAVFFCSVGNRCRSLSRSKNWR